MFLRKEQGASWQAWQEVYVDLTELRGRSFFRAEV